MRKLPRRKLITAGLGVMAGVTGLPAALRIADRFGLIPPDYRGIYGPGVTLTYGVQRLLTRHSLAREFSPDQISTAPFANGKAPGGELYERLKAGGFAEWRVQVDGLVSSPSSFSVAELKSFPSSRQITHLACEEGWSFIAEWIGVPLSHVLNLAGTQPQARYVVYYSMDQEWWDSIDIAEALHPQTLLTYGMNGGDLPVGHGAPIRLRVPRQLGYKSVKYITRLTVTDNLKGFGKGLGSAEPEFGYSWFAGI